MDGAWAEGHDLNIKSGHIYVNTYSEFKGYNLTSDSDFITIDLRNGGLRFEGSIIDSIDHPVGLRIIGDDWRPYSVLMYIRGNNSYTGLTEISGKEASLILNREAGFIAMSGDALVRDGASLESKGISQIAKNSTVTLDNGNLILNSMSRSEKKESFKRLIVNKESVLSFHHHSNAYLYLEDLVINSGSELQIDNWADGKTWLLVKKTSEHLDDALKHIVFSGYAPGKVSKVDYNSEYWAISALPEPATYGAVLGAVGVSLFFWRRRGRSVASVSLSR